MQFSAKLRGWAMNNKEVKDEEDEKCLGGLRSTADVIEHCPMHTKIGRLVGQLFKKFIDEDSILSSALIKIIDHKLCDDEFMHLEGIINKHVNIVREQLGFVLGEGRIDEIKENDCSTCIRAHLLRRWAELAQDPGVELCDWLIRGAGAGLSVMPSEASTVFPLAGKDAKFENPDDAYDFGHEYISATVDEEAVKEIEKFAEAGWLKEYPDIQAVERELGKPATVSPFHVVVKTKEGRTKRRLILDLKRSGISARTAHTHRVVLPRISDLVRDILLLLADATAEEEVEIFVLDFKDAFWNVPLHPRERRHFVGAAGGRLWAYHRAAQGSRNGPLAWAGPASVLMRCTQGMLTGIADGTKRARTELYVDDPAAAIKGTKTERDLTVKLIILMWRVLGFPVAFSKARRGRRVVWIGGDIEIMSDRVSVRIPEDKLAELAALTDNFLSGNTVGVKALRRYAGLANHMASVLFVWRPFLSELWAALQAFDGGRCSGAPAQCVWTCMVAPALSWIRAFLKQTKGTLEVTYRVDAFLNLGRRLQIVGDACIWGLGAYLVVDGIPTEYYAVPVSRFDEIVLGISRGDPKAQQALEALNLLVALRQWSAWWRQDRVALEVRADNVAALTLLLRLKGSSPALNRVAREVAIDLGNAAYRPDVLTHTPGVASTTADALSRRFDPDFAYKPPHALSGACEVQPVARNKAYWLTLEPAKHAELRRASTANHDQANEHKDNDGHTRDGNRENEPDNDGHKPENDTEVDDYGNPPAKQPKLKHNSEEVKHNPEVAHKVLNKAGAEVFQ